MSGSRGVTMGMTELRKRDTIDHCPDRMKLNRKGDFRGMTENRMFQRIRFVAETEVEIGGLCRRATLVDISLKGALLAFDDEAVPEKGQSCHLKMHLDQSDVILSFTGLVAHSHDNLTGIRFVTVDIATMIHLRSLLELNSGDPELVRSELNAFIDSL